MDDATNGHRPPPGSRPPSTPEGRARLLAALDLERARHPVDAGALGEYVEQLDRDGLASARARLPTVAAHLSAGCDACNAEVVALRELSALDADPSESPRPGVAGAVEGQRLGRTADGSVLTSGDGSAHAALGAAADGAPAAAPPPDLRRQHRVLLTGLVAVAAGALVVMAATLYTLLSIAPGSGTGEVKLIARETLTVPASGPALAPTAPPPPATVLATPVGQAAPVAQPGGSPSAIGGVPPQGSDCPAAQPIKANRQSGIYHLRGGEFYDRTRPEVCFATPEDAERAGFRRSLR